MKKIKIIVILVLLSLLPDTPALSSDVAVLYDYTGNMLDSVEILKEIRDDVIGFILDGNELPPDWEVVYNRADKEFTPFLEDGAPLSGGSDDALIIGFYGNDFITDEGIPPHLSFTFDSSDFREGVRSYYTTKEKIKGGKGHSDLAIAFAVNKLQGDDIIPAPIYVFILSASSPEVEETVEEAPPTIDVVFTIDTTSSMDDEITGIKDGIVDLIAEIEAGTPKPDVRYGMVLYRDRGDDYVTMDFPLTDDTDSIIDSIKGIETSGGGDTPESVNKALDVSIGEMAWSEEADRRVIFLIGDAEPKTYSDEGDISLENLVKGARDSGIVINSIGAGGLSDTGEDFFISVAEETGGSFRFVEYGAGDDNNLDYILTEGIKLELAERVTWEDTLPITEAKVIFDEVSLRFYHGLIYEAVLSGSEIYLRVFKFKGKLKRFYRDE